MKPYKRIFNKSFSEKYLCKTKDEDAIVAIVLHESITANGPLIDRYLLRETIIDISTEIKSIKETLKNIFIKYSGKKINVIIPYIEEALKTHKIKFVSNHLDLPNYIDVADYRQEQKDFIFILYSDKVLNDLIDINEYNIFTNELITLLGHEIIHRFQKIKINNEELSKILLKKSRKDLEKYYSSKYEIMSYAWQIINNFRVYGKKDSDIKIILQSDSEVKYKFGGLIFETYHTFFTIQDEPLKLLYKYMYLYLGKN